MANPKRDFFESWVHHYGTLARRYLHHLLIEFAQVTHSAQRGFHDARIVLGYPRLHVSGKHFAYEYAVRRCKKCQPRSVVGAHRWTKIYEGHLKNIKDLGDVANRHLDHITGIQDILWENLPKLWGGYSRPKTRKHVATSITCRLIETTT